MEEISIKFFTYSIYCLTILIPVALIERIGIRSSVKSFFSLGVRSFHKTLENINPTKIKELKGEEVITKSTKFQFDENGTIYIRSLMYRLERSNFRGSAKIKAVAKVASQNRLHVQSYSFLEHTLSLIFLPIVCVAGIIGASYNPNGNAELGFIPLIGGVIFFIFSKFEHRRKFRTTCKELEEILAENNVKTKN